MSSPTGRSFLPGPVEVHPAVLGAMQRPIVGHRTRAGHELAERIQGRLALVFGTARPVMIATASATALMEGAIRSGVERRLLAVIGGAFGERFADIAERCGKEVVRVHVHPGRPVVPDQLAVCLDGPPIDAASLVHCETSTGVVEDVTALLATIRARHPDIVTIVDAVGSLGGIPYNADQVDADFVLAASQKALGLPPGISFAVASNRFLERARSIADRGVYLDVVQLHDCARRGRFAFTPAIPVIHALDLQLDRIATEGLGARWARHGTMQRVVEEWVGSHGRCEHVALAGHRASTVTALRLADGRSARQLVAALEEVGWMIAAGIGDAEDRIIRIGHMGDMEPQHLLPLFDILEPRL